MSTQMRVHPLHPSADPWVKPQGAVPASVGGAGGAEKEKGTPLHAPKPHQPGPLKGSCVTCLLRELLLVCRGWACLSLACWHTILGLLQTNATESDTCPEHLVKITSLLPSLPRCLLPLLHSSPLHLPPRFIYFLPLLLHRNGHWVVLLVVHSCSPSANCMVWFSLHVW